MSTDILCVGRGLPSNGDFTFEILGNTAAIEEVRRLVGAASSSNVNVFITGETGTGKELVANAICAVFRSRGSPIVAQNCAAVPSELFESQFFGHRRGAFTGALSNHTGLVELADGGILFLDELDSLTIANQAKLLRVIDDGEVRPLGCSESRRVNVRYIAAMNSDPRDLIETGALREDLYYRLAGFEIHIPPLRERPEDVPVLARHFLGDPRHRISRRAAEELRRFSWPGNVRQLRNVIQAANALAAGEVIRRSHLRLARDPRPVKGHGAGQPAPHRIAIRSLKDAERHTIAAALRFYGGNRSHTARVLGIDRSTLRRKIRELGLDAFMPEPANGREVTRAPPGIDGRESGRLDRPRGHGRRFVLDRP